MATPLLLGPIKMEGISCRRSGFRWLRPDGHDCAAGEPIAYCSFGFKPIPGIAPPPYPFQEERRDLQVVLSTPVAGRLTHGSESSRGGFFDQLLMYDWDADYAIGHIHSGADAAPNPAGVMLQMTTVAGRRATEVAEMRSGLLTGWHNRQRAWRADADGPIGTALSLGICELDGVIKGHDSAFLEIFEQVSGAAQIVFVPDPPLVPTNLFLLEKMDRTEAEFEAISRDLMQTLASGDIPLSPEDWILAGAMLKQLQTSPITDTYPIFTRQGLGEAGPADAIILSVSSESRMLLRHKTLGYSCWMHHFRLADTGRALRRWLVTQFEPVSRTLDDVKTDYCRLIDRIWSNAPATQILICNAMSSDGLEDIQSYAGFDAPLHNTLPTVEAKDVNLMLCDLAQKRDIAIIDIDAIAAELGARTHLDSKVHQSGLMQAAIRQEILDTLRARGVPGFSAP